MEVFAPQLWLGETCLRVSSNALCDLIRIKLCKGWLVLGKLDGSYTYGPYVSAQIVAVLVEDLRTHPEGRANDTLFAGQAMGQLRGDSKVRDLGYALSA